MRDPRQPRKQEHSNRVRCETLAYCAQLTPASNTNKNQQWGQPELKCNTSSTQNSRTQRQPRCATPAKRASKRKEKKKMPRKRLRCVAHARCAQAIPASQRTEKQAIGPAGVQSQNEFQTKSKDAETPSLSLVVPRCPPLSPVVPRCPAVSLANPRCPSLSLVVPRCPSLSLVVPRCPSVSLAVAACACGCLRLLVAVAFFRMFF